MKILLDARMLGHSFGIGVYTRELAKRLPKLGKKHDWIFLVRPEVADYTKRTIIGENKNAKIVVEDIRHYSWAEQTRLPWIFKQLKPDLVHFPNFNVPILFDGKYVTTIHDMIHHRIPGHRRGSSIWRLAYKTVMGRAVRKSKAIITVSKHSKQEIKDVYPRIPTEKIFVIPEGVSDVFNPQELPGEIYNLKEKYGIKQPYMVFVGVWERKKNLPFLVKMFTQIADKHPDLKLVLAGKEDPWHPEVAKEVKEYAGYYWNRVITPGFIDMEDLPALYRQAEAFVNPSTNEGFGLPGLEAMACNTPVIVADIPVFHEVYGPAAVYFDYQDKEKAAKVLDKVLSNEKEQKYLKLKGVEQAGKYTWEETAARTIKLYEQAVNGG